MLGSSDGFFWPNNFLKKSILLNLYFPFYRSRIENLIKYFHYLFCPQLDRIDAATSESLLNNRNPLFLVLGIVAAILAPIVATLIQLAISRQREYLADATGALTTRPRGSQANDSVPRPGRLTEIGS